MILSIELVLSSEFYFHRCYSICFETSVQTHAYDNVIIFHGQIKSTKILKTICSLGHNVVELYNVLEQIRLTTNKKVTKGLQT